MSLTVGKTKDFALTYDRICRWRPWGEVSEELVADWHPLALKGYSPYEYNRLRGSIADQNDVICFGDSEWIESDEIEGGEARIEICYSFWRNLFDLDVAVSVLDQLPKRSNMIAAQKDSLDVKRITEIIGDVNWNVVCGFYSDCVIFQDLPDDDDVALAMSL